MLMELLGLSRHHSPAAFIWSDVGPNVAALATLAGARGDARDVAGWLWTSAVGHHSGHGGFAGEYRALGESQQEHMGATTCAMYRQKYGQDERGRPYAPQGCSRSEVAAKAETFPGGPEVAAIIRTWKDEEPRALWERLKAAGWPSLMPPKGMRWGHPILGRWLGPCEVREVAGWLVAAGQAYQAGSPSTGFALDRVMDKRRPETSWLTADNIGQRVATLPSRWPRVACYQGTATRMVEQLPGDLSGFVVYVDGPYHGDGSRKITGYKFGGCSREEQLAMAADCHRRGARVAMSESVPLAAELRALTGAEWWEVDITEHREGQSRTFGATREYVTVNAAPLHMRGTQQGLFGVPDDRRHGDHLRGVTKIIGGLLRAAKVEK